MAPKASKQAAAKPDKEAQREQMLALRDIKEKMFRACVVPAAYSVEEQLLGLCSLPEFRMKSIKLTEDEVGYGQFAMRNLGKRILSAYFAGQAGAKLFEEVYGFPMTELKTEGLICMRPWHDEVIVVMAPPKAPMRCFVNSIIRETLSTSDKDRVSWTGNLLILTSSLQAEISPDLSGVSRYTLSALLQEKLQKVAPSLQAAWSSKQPGVDMNKQFGWLKDLQRLQPPPPPAPAPTAPLSTQLEYMLTGWKHTRCLLPYRHSPDKCSGFHVLPAGANSTSTVFDARRLPLKDGEQVYAPEWCRSGPPESARDGPDTVYLTCPAGPSCTKAHSRLELFYHPAFFKHQKCEGVSGGTCSCQESGTPDYVCAFWHRRAETNALTGILQRLAPGIQPPWGAADGAFEDEDDVADEQQQLLEQQSSSVSAAAAGSAGGADVAAAAGGSDGGGVPSDYDAVDMEALRYLFFGPPNNTDVVSWFYVDPGSIVQGPFAAEDMFSWCSQRLLPLDLLLHPGSQGMEQRPTAIEEFWPMSTLLTMAQAALQQQSAAAPAAAAAAAPAGPAGAGTAAGVLNSVAAPVAAPVVAAPPVAAPVVAAPVAAPVIAPVAAPVAAPVVAPVVAAPVAQPAAVSSQPVSEAAGTGLFMRGFGSSSSLSAAAAAYDPLQQAPKPRLSTADSGASSAAGSVVGAAATPESAAAAATAVAAAAALTAAAGSRSSSRLSLLNITAREYRPGSSTAASSINSASVTPTATQATTVAAAAAQPAAGAGSSTAQPQQQQEQAAAGVSKAQLSVSAPAYQPGAAAAGAAGAGTKQPVAAASRSSSSGGSSSSELGPGVLQSTPSPQPPAAAPTAELSDPQMMAFGSFGSDELEQLEGQEEQQEQQGQEQQGQEPSQQQEQQEQEQEADVKDRQQAGEQVAEGAADKEQEEEEGEFAASNPYSLLSAAQQGGNSDEEEAVMLTLLAASPAAAAAAAAAAPSTSSSSSKAPAKPQQASLAQQPGQVVVSMRVYHVGASNPKESAYTVSNSRAVGTTCADLGQELTSGSPAWRTYSSSSSSCSSAMLLWVRPGQPFPTLRLLQPQERLADLLQQLAGDRGPAATAAAGLNLEAYCSAESVFEVSNPWSSTMLQRLVYTGNGFKQNLESAVEWDTAGGVTGSSLTSPRKLDWALRRLAQAFEGAVQQGKLWRHDQDWAVFNSGLLRSDSSGRHQLVFLSRRTWGANVTAPWVAVNKLEDSATAQRWLKGSLGPPVPVITSSSTGSGAGSGYSSNSAAGMTLLPPPQPFTPSGAASTATSWLSRAGSGSGDAPAAPPPPRPSSQQGRAAAAAAGAATPKGAGPGSTQQQQQQQQQLVPVVWPPSACAFGPSIVSRIGSSSFGYGHFSGTFIPSSLLGSVQQQQQEGNSSSSSGGTAVHALGQHAAAAAAAAAGPLLASPVLPTYPMPPGTGALPSASAFAAAAGGGSDREQQQQRCVDLAASKPAGPRLLMIPTATHPAASQQQQDEEEQQPARVLCSPLTTAEELTAALSAEKDNADSSSSETLVLAYSSTDSSSNTTAWRILQSAALAKLADASAGSAGVGAAAAATAAAVQHPLGAQISFPDAPHSTLSLEVYAAAPQQQQQQSLLSPLINSCVCWDTDAAAAAAAAAASAAGDSPQTGLLQSLCQQMQARRPSRDSSSSTVSGEQAMLSEVASLAAAEYWGGDEGLPVLAHYLSSNFFRAAVQGRLLMFNSSSSSEHGAAEAGQQQLQHAVMMFNTGLSTPAGQHVLMLFARSSHCQPQQQQDKEEQDKQEQPQRPAQPWLYLGTATSFDCAALQPLPAPAAAPVAAFNPQLPLQVDVDALVAAFSASSGQPDAASSSSSAALSAAPQQQQERLRQQLVVGGQPLPAAAAEAVVQGGIAKSLLLLQRTPHLACQVLVQGERLLYAVPLLLFAGEPVRLVLLLEMMSGREGGGVMYCSVGVAPFADVYAAVRALGPCDWLSWAKEAVAAMQEE